VFEQRIDLLESDPDSTENHDTERAPLFRDSRDFSPGTPTNSGPETVRTSTGTATETGSRKLSSAVDTASLQYALRYRRQATVTFSVHLGHDCRSAITVILPSTVPSLNITGLQHRAIPRIVGAPKLTRKLRGAA
jgi:hypothetical protein